MAFREMRRKNQALSNDDCKALLKNERRAVLAVNGDNGYPYAIPVDYFYDEATDKIYFHGAKAGHKYDAISADDKVCFTVYGNECFKDGDWAAYVQSVVIFGKCRILSDKSEILSHAKDIGLKYYPTPDSVEEIVNDTADRIQVFEISIEHMTGKQVHEE